MSTLVSVGIPTYNRVASLEAAIASVLGQSHTDLELVIGDNASTDATPALCASAAARDPRVRVLRHPGNLGPTANFNAVLAALRGRFVMLLADDDVLDAGFLERCRATLRAEPGLSLVHGRTTYAGPDGPRYGADLDLTAAEPAQRVLDYLGSVFDNGAFYGLQRAGAVRAALPLPNVLAADWLWVARLAFQGGVRVQRDAALVRAPAGTSASYARIADVLRLPPRAARHPHATIIANVHHDIAAGSPIYAGLGRAGRRRLAARAAAVVLRAQAYSLAWDEVPWLMADERAMAALRAARTGWRR